MAFQETEWITKTPLDKLPDEQLTRSADFTNWLDTGVTITDCNCTIEDEDETDVTADMLEGDPSISSPSVSFVVKAGTEGTTYILKFELILSNGDTNIAKLKIRVK